jgi:acyl-CoA thioesterase I
MHVDRRTSIAVVAIAALVTAWLLRTDRPHAARPTAGRQVVLFGDSLAEGRGATPDHDLAALLSERIGTAVINAGQSGDTTASALARLEPAVLARDPRIVIVLLGGNDYLRRMPADDTFRNLSTIVERIRQRGAAVVLVGVSVGLLRDPYRAEYEALARRTSAALVPDILGGIIGHGELMSDAIHPNDRGYAMMADRLEPVVRDLARTE